MSCVYTQTESEEARRIRLLLEAADRESVLGSARVAWALRRMAEEAIPVSNSAPEAA